MMNIEYLAMPYRRPGTTCTTSDPKYYCLLVHDNRVIHENGVQWANSDIYIRTIPALQCESFEGKEKKKCKLAKPKKENNIQEQTRENNNNNNKMKCQEASKKSKSKSL